MAERRSSRARQRQVLALLLAVGALVFPLSGAASYTTTDGAPTRFVLLGAAGPADMLAPMMLAGALALIVLVRPEPGAGLVRVTPLVIVAAALVLALAFLGSAWVLDGTEFRAGSSGARLATMAGLVVEGALSLAIAGFAMRAMTEQKQVAVP